MVLLVSLGAAWLAYVVSLNAGVRDLQDSAVRRFDGVSVALANALARFDSDAANSMRRDARKLPVITVS